MLLEIFQSTRGASVFLRPPKNSKAGGSFGLAPRFACLRGAMAHHASRNFAKHARGVSIFEASNKFPSGGLVRSRHQLDEGLREAWSSILFGIYRMRNARSKFSLFLKLLDSQQFRRTRRSLREFSIFWSQVRISHLIFSIHTPQLLYSSEQGSQTSRAVGERIAG